MATLNVLQSRRQQTSSGLAFILAYCKQDFKTEHEGRRLVTGVGCVADDAYREMMNTKLRFHKTDGRMYYHLVQSFSPNEDVSPEKAHEIALWFAAEQFPGYEVLVATHVDKDHLHSHLIVNAVSFETGRKYHSDKENIQRLRDASDKLCREYSLSVLEKAAPSDTQKMSAREYRSADKGESWKLALTVQINDVMKVAPSKEAFVALMEAEGYGMTWTPDRKYVTYRCPNGRKCRDNKLHEIKYTKERMEYEFRIRAEITRGITGAAAKEPARGSANRAVLRGDGTELEGAAGLGEAAFRSAFDADRAERFAGDERGFGSVDGRLDEGSAQLYDRDGHADGGVSAEAGDGGGSIYEVGPDGVWRFIATGWERERAVFLLALGGEREYAAVQPQAVLDLADPERGLSALDTVGLGLDAVAKLGSLVESGGEDPETKRKRIEAERNGENIGALIGFGMEVVKLAVAAHRKKQEAEAADDPAETEDETPCMTLY